MAARARVAVAVCVLWVTAGALQAQISRDEVLASVYPGASVRAERLFLTTDQVQRISRAAGSEVPSALVARYVASRAGQVVGRAYVDTHTVRTKKESLLVSLDDAGRVRRVDVTAFLEPAEYEAPEAWLRQYGGRELADDVAVDRAIRPIAGATLTARAANAAVRRVLAIDRELTGGMR